MIMISYCGGVVRRLVRPLGFAAAAMLALSTVPQGADALSLINPGAAPATKAVTGGLTTEVAGRGGGVGGFHGGGGGGFHGGGGFLGGGAAFHGGMSGGGAVFHGGGFRSGPVFHGGGYRTAYVFRGGFHHGGFAFRHHHRRFFYGSYYPYDDYPYYYSYRRCHIVWTYYGPRRVCHFRPWHHHYWHHHHRHHRFHRYW